MNRCLGILLLLHLAAWCLPITGRGQGLRIDLDRINAEGKLQKTNGDYLNYLSKEITSIVKAYGKTSREYVYLKGFYWDEYNRILRPVENLNSLSLKEYAEGREELVECSRKAYGDNSVEYAYAILMDVMNYTNTWNAALDSVTFKRLKALTDQGISNITGSHTLQESDRLSYLTMLYSEKGSVFIKAGIRDSALAYYRRVLDIRTRHPLYDRFFSSFLQLYASALADSSFESSLQFLAGYEPLMKEKYAADQEEYYQFLRSLLSKFLQVNYAGPTMLTSFLTADSLCRQLYGEVSEKYTDFILTYKIPCFQKLGWKAMVYQGLKDLDETVFKKDPTLLSQSEHVFIRFHLEWYYYYLSVNEPDYGLQWLKWAEKNDQVPQLSRLSFPDKLTLYRELAHYYRSRSLDSCLRYSFKVLELEQQAKQQWGDYTISQYVEIAQLYLGTGDKDFTLQAGKYCQLALDEFEQAYGKGSDAYNSALFTMGEWQHLQSKGSSGRQKMWPLVYRQLDNSRFIPPLNASGFQEYGDILNEDSQPDSADFFYNEIYRRNGAGLLFRILGTTRELQLGSLGDFYAQNDLVLTKLLDRYKKSGNKYVSKSLAQHLFQKNLMDKLQGHLRETLQDSRNDKLGRHAKDLSAWKKDKTAYDSLLYTATRETALIDSALLRYDFDKNCLITDYLLDHSKDSTAFRDLRKGYAYDEVQHSLHDGECLVDIIRFYPAAAASPAYAFTILTHKQEEKLEIIFVEDALAMERWQGSGDQDKVSAILSRLITRLAGYKKIYVCPDGIFHLLNLYSLKDADGALLIQHKDIRYLDNPGQVPGGDEAACIGTVRDATGGPVKEKKASFFGNPVYTSHSKASSVENSIFPDAAFTALRELPYSRVEIETAAELLAKKGWSIDIYTGQRCSEANLKLLHSPEILHIATHGYYISGKDTSGISYALQKDASLRSGLVLGVVSPNKKDLNDNVLTAYEAANLDLNNTSLVVLSACESAKGENVPGQGVYGLVSAFEMAGARNVLVSVKQVDDKATQLLMEYFYTFVAGGSNYADALKLAQLQMLRHPLFKDPVNWDGFILVSQ
ncbi:MAG TPA: CHAT domain-containing protein [Puia sp.]|nr:CHAT domain-containing protein [Puia sp.]